MPVCGRTLCETVHQAKVEAALLTWKNLTSDETEAQTDAQGHHLCENSSNKDMQTKVLAVVDVLWLNVAGTLSDHPGQLCCSVPKRERQRNANDPTDNPSKHGHQDRSEGLPEAPHIPFANFPKHSHDD